MKTLRLAIVLEKGDGTCWGIQVPDLPGCFSGADTLDEVHTCAKDAIMQHFSVAAEPFGGILDIKPTSIQDTYEEFIERGDGAWTMISYVDVPLQETVVGSGQYFAPVGFEILPYAVTTTNIDKEINRPEEL
jgi:predicted RNase H-like HicB family nuclease